MRDIDRRRYPRFPVDLVGGIGPATREVVERRKTGRITDISLGGVFIETDLSFRDNTVVSIELRLPTDTQPRVVLGMVRWVRDTDPKGVGVQFTSEYEEQIRVAIIEYTRKMAGDEA